MIIKLLALNFKNHCRRTENAKESLWDRLKTVFSENHITNSAKIVVVNSELEKELIPKAKN